MDSDEAASIILEIRDYYGLTKEDAPAYHGMGPYQVLVATILSQQTTERSGTRATEALLSEYPGPEEMYSADPGKVLEKIAGCRFCRQKAAAIMGCTRIIMEEYGGKVPDDPDALLAMPMVGSKTMSCVMRYGFGRPCVIVDTHIARVSRRLGLSDGRDADHVQQDLTDLVPQELWDVMDGALIFLGRDLCKPGAPQCEKCPVNTKCRFFTE